MHAETQQYYIMPDANIAGITWSEPRLHYDFSEKLKKLFQEKYLAKLKHLVNSGI